MALSALGRDKSVHRRDINGSLRDENPMSAIVTCLLFCNQTFQSDLTLRSAVTFLVIFTVWNQFLEGSHGVFGEKKKHAFSLSWSWGWSLEWVNVGRETVAAQGIFSPPDWKIIPNSQKLFLFATNKWEYKIVETYCISTIESPQTEKLSKFGRRKQLVPEQNW